MRWLICTLGACCALAAPPARLHGRIEASGGYRLQGNMHRIPATALDAGPAEPSLMLPRITLHLAMTASQQSALKSLLEAQQTRGSSQYHRWLTPEQFAERFGANESDIRKITAWLENQGFANIVVARSRTAINFSGTADQVEWVFGTPLCRYRMDGALHYANTSEPELPGALKGIVESMRGLNDFRPKPHLIQSQAVAGPQFTFANSTVNLLSPADFATIYDLNPVYNCGVDGTGQTIVVVGQSDFDMSDIEAFRSAAGLPANDPQVILIPGPDPGTNDSGNEREADLDLEWAGAIAKNAHVVYVNSGTQSGVFDSLVYAVDNNLGGVLVFAYGLCEPTLGSADANALNNVLAHASAQGMTVVAASGDAGPAACDQGTDASSGKATQGLAVGFPASSPYVTAVGGTQFNDGPGTGPYWQTSVYSTLISSALSYIPEKTWNESAGDGYLAASGGGASTLFPKPAWQTGSGVPADGARDVPDIAFSASVHHDGYLVCTGGNCANGFLNASSTSVLVTGGTSSAVAALGGVVALLDQETNQLQGSLNPRLYSLASILPDVFHDVTQGGNMVNCQESTPDCPVSYSMGFSAGPGYDQATGLESIDAYNLFREWNADFQIAITPTTLSLNPGSSATAVVTITPSGGFSQTVSFACSVSSGLANTTCSIPGTVPGSGSATLTISAASNASVPVYGGIAACGLVGFLLWPRKRARLAAAALAVLAFSALSCGGGESSSPSATLALQSVAESGTVTVTATSGTLSHTSTVNVTVQ